MSSLNRPIPDPSGREGRSFIKPRRVFFMFSPQLFLFMIASTVASGMACYNVRKRLLAARMMDHPNELSLHAAAVPRGGGLGLWLAALGLWIYALQGAGHIGINRPFLFGVGG